MNETADVNLTMSPARVLLGWMDTEQGLRAQHGFRADVEVSPESEERLRLARERVAARRAGIDQRDVVTPAPKALAPHIDELRRHPVTEKVFAEGWSASILDLRRLCAFQARVFTEHGDERVRAIDAHDPLSVAAVSLPVPGPVNIPACYDSTRNAWVLSSPDPNLKVTGHMRQQLNNDVCGFGFSVTLGRSFVAAVQRGGRYYLTDGYHRAVAFLRRGITHVPALVRTVRDDEPFKVASGVLPPAAYLGDRPPQLADFLADEVSLSVDLPIFRKVIVIQAIEVMG